MADLHPEVLALIEAGPQRLTTCAMCKGSAVRVVRGFTGKEATHWCQVCKGTGGIEETHEEFDRRIALRAVELEREECAKVCMRRIDTRWAEHSVVESDTNAAYYPKSVAWMETADEEAEDCAAAIRRRGKP